MAFLDLVIISVYLLTILGVVAWLGVGQTPAAFLVNDRKTTLVFLIGSIVSTNVGAATYVGITSAAFATGISYPLSATVAVVLGFLLVALVAPFIRAESEAHGYYTMGDFFRQRYSRRCQVVASIILFLAYLLFTAAQVRAVGLMLNHWTGFPLEVAVWVAGLTMIAYTAVAGIRSDLYTDVVHFAVMVLGMIALVPIVFDRVGGLQALGTLGATHFDVYAYSGPMFFFGSIIFGLPLMLSSMEVWQKLFAAVDRRTARRAMLGAAAINSVFLVVPLLLGLGAATMWPGGHDPDQTFFRLLDLLPTGLLGLAVAALIAAILSTANSMILVLGAIASRDFVGIDPSSDTDAATILKLRAWTGGAGLLALGVATLGTGLVETMVGGFQIIVVLAPAIMLGLFSQRGAEPAAYGSMVAGAVGTAIAYPWLGTTAFVPGLLLGLLALGAGMIREARAVAAKH